MVCERHSEIVDTLTDYGKRIRELEISDATILQKIENLTDSIKELINWIKLAVLAMAGTGTGFIIWYIQSL